MLRACQNCQHRLRSRRDAVSILRELIEIAELHELEGGGTMIQARLDVDQVTKLCVWDTECDDCEDPYDHEADAVEVESQFETSK